MKREIYLDASTGAVRAAIVEDGVLCELLSEKKDVKKLTETIFLGRVEQIRPSVGAAFVHIGEELNAFLPLSPDETLRCGDMIIVQGAARQATETKGLRITRKINIAGKWLVLVPGDHGVHVSKKIKDADLREALQRAGNAICPPDCALIVRTASEGITEEAMAAEAQALYARWQYIRAKSDTQRKPGILCESLPLWLRIVRDFSGKELSGILVNDLQLFRDLSDEQNEGRISPDTSIRYYQEKDQLLFDVFSIEAQIDKALRRRVWLPCGGYLIFDACEAMTVIDVNSGKMILGRDTEETALRVNLEAADEIARQLRLRDIGGMIVVDCIDMKDAQNRDALLARMKEAVSLDRSPVKIEGLTKLGLLEMTRKRVSASLSKRMQSSCSYCSGDGLLLSAAEVSQRAMRQLRRLSLSGQRGPFVVRCAASVAAEMLKETSPIAKDVYVLCAQKHAERFDIEQIGESTPVPRDAVAMKKDNGL